MRLSGAKLKAKIHLQSSPLSSVTGLHLWAMTAAVQLRRTATEAVMLMNCMFDAWGIVFS